MVTAVLADYRGFDTLGETLVVFTAGIACVLVLLGGVAPARRRPATTTEFGSPVLDAAVRLLTPFLMLFSAYVLVHGHYSPGGGFPGGAVLAGALVLVRLVPAVRVDTAGSAGGVLGRASRGGILVASF